MFYALLDSRVWLIPETASAGNFCSVAGSLWRIVTANMRLHLERSNEANFWIGSVIDHALAIVNLPNRSDRVAGIISEEVIAL